MKTLPRLRAGKSEPEEATMSSALGDPPVEIRSGQPDDHWEGPAPRGGLAGRLPTLPALSPIPTYVGIAISAIGFVAIAFAWGKVAGIANNVALQLPYLVSGGLTGLGLVMVGVTIVSVAAKRRDAQLREQQTQLLADALRELRNALEPR